MSFSTEAIIAIVSLSISTISVAICGYMACKKIEQQKKISDARIIKVKSSRDIHAKDLLNELDIIKGEIEHIKENNTQLTNKMTRAVQKILGDEWSAYYDENHQAYYWYNKMTGETTWINPAESI